MPGGTVLLIDNDVDTARILSELLTQAGYRMLHAGSLREARRLLRETEPDVVVVEPYAFGRDRWTEVAALGRGEARRPVAVVALTTLAADAQLARSAGCARFLAKPVSPRRVLAAIDAVARASDAPPGAEPARPVPL